MRELSNTLSTKNKGDFPSFNLIRVLLIFLFAIGLALRFLLINQEIEIVLKKFFADDAFYYFALVRNIIHGYGVVFNYGIPTNGFHPLYALILIPIFKLFYPVGINVPIYAALTLIALLNAGTAIFLYLGVRRLAGRGAGLLATFIWLFNPYILFTAYMGTETSLQVFFISALVYYLISRDHRSRFTLRESVMIGLLMGVVILSRLDGLLLSVGIVLAIVIRKIRHIRAAKFRSQYNFPSDIMMIIGISGLVVLPWIAFSLIKVHRLTPVSGEALRVLRLQHFAYLQLVFRAILTTGMFVVDFFGAALISSLKTVSFISAFSLLFIPLVLLIGRAILKKDRFLRKLIRSLDFMIIGSILYYAGYWFYALGLRPWYSIYTSFMLTMVFSIMIAGLIQWIQNIWVRASIFTVIICLLVVNFIYVGANRYRRGNFPMAALHREIAKYLDENISSSEAIGSFNTGIYQYFAEQHDIINLDGVMNPDAFHKMKNGDIEKYVLSKDIKYIIDPMIYVEGLNRSIINFEPLQTFTQPPHGGNFYTYKLYKISPVQPPR